MTTQTQFSTEALRNALQSRLGLSLDIEAVRALAEEAATLSISSPVRPLSLNAMRALADEAATLSGSLPDLSMDDDVGPFFYNVVFLSKDHTPMSSPLFITVKTSTRISYGSDLLALRQKIQKLCNYNDLVITSYSELAGPSRPHGVIPTVEIAQEEPHRRPS